MQIAVPIKITTATASLIHHFFNSLVRTLYLLYFNIFLNPLTFIWFLQPWYFHNKYFSDSLKNLLFAHLQAGVIQ